MMEASARTASIAGSRIMLQGEMLVIVSCIAGVCLSRLCTCVPSQALGSIEQPSSAWTTVHRLPCLVGDVASREYRYIAPW